MRAHVDKMHGRYQLQIIAVINSFNMLFLCTHVTDSIHINLDDIYIKQ